MESGIYIIKNLVNNKLYIGSAVNLKKRKREHFSLLKNNKHHSIYLQRAYNKYGKDNFIFELLECCEKTVLIIREQHYIDLINPNYNISKIAGSCIGIIRSKETIKRLSESHKGQIPWNKGIPATKEQKENQSKLMTGRVSGAKGIKWCDKSKLKLSLSKLNKKLSTEHKQNLSKKIYEYDINNILIKEFNSVTELAFELNSFISNVVRAIKNNKQFKKRTFKYEKQ